MTAVPIARKEAYELWASLEAEFARYHRAVNFIPTDETRLQDDLRRYLCLRCAGFLEKLVHQATLHYLESVAGGPGLRFAQSFYSHAPNLNPRSFKKLLERFGEPLVSSFESFLTPSRRDTLEDLSAIRNPIAHGSVTGGRKLDPMRYKKLCEDVYQWLNTELVKPVGVSEFV